MTDTDQPTTGAALADECRETRMAMFLETLAAIGGQADAEDHPHNWIMAFCSEHEGRDPDTFNLAIQHEFTRVTHDNDTDEGMVYLTDNGRRAIPRLRAQAQALHAPAQVEGEEWTDSRIISFMADFSDMDDNGLGRDTRCWIRAMRAALTRSTAAPAQVEGEANFRIGDKVTIPRNEPWTGDWPSTEVHEICALIFAPGKRAEAWLICSGDTAPTDGFPLSGLKFHSRSTTTPSTDDEAVRLLEALTPSADTKAEYMGEFSFTVGHYDEEGDEVFAKTYVPWTTIKEIMKAIRNRAYLTRKGSA